MQYNTVHIFEVIKHTTAPAKIVKHYSEKYFTKTLHCSQHVFYCGRSRIDRTCSPINKILPQPR